jgi:hypothetical protein
MDCSREACLSPDLQWLNSAINLSFEYYITVLQRLSAAARTLHSKLCRCEARYEHNSSDQIFYSPSSPRTAINQIQTTVESSRESDPSLSPTTNPARLQGMAAVHESERQPDSYLVSRILSNLRRYSTSLSGHGLADDQIVDAIVPQSETAINPLLFAESTDWKKSACDPNNVVGP